MTGTVYHSHFFLSKIEENFRATDGRKLPKITDAYDFDADAHNVFNRICRLKEKVKRPAEEEELWITINTPAVSARPRRI